MDKKTFFISVVVVVVSFFASACGGGSDSTAGSGNEIGGGINNDWDIETLTCEGTYTGGTVSSGGASVVIADGVVSSCVNISTDTPPVLEAATSLPTGFDVRTGEQNVTDNGIGYTFSINGSGANFRTDSSDNVTIILPFDASLVAAGDRDLPYRVFIRIIDNATYSLVDVTGSIDPSGIVSANVFGLPDEFTASVIYNPNMTVYEVAQPTASVSGPLAATSEPPWRNSGWCVVYDPFDADLITVVQNILGTASPTIFDVLGVVRDYVADYAADSQSIYEAAGFRAPMLFIQPSTSSFCASNYYVHLTKQGSKYRPEDPDEVIADDGHPYGRLYVSVWRLDDGAGAALGSSKASVSHEMLHAIQDGYDIFFTDSYKGYCEGSATTYGKTIDNNMSVTVRSASALEIQLLSNFLMIGKKGNSITESYSNQDFFAYVAREHNNDGLDYLPGLFEKIRVDVGNAADALSPLGLHDSWLITPPYYALLLSMDSYFESTFGRSVKSIYLDFLKQRALAHNQNSRFGRTGEINIGFAENLFEVNATDATLNSLIDVTIDPIDCSVTNGAATFAYVAPLAARALRLRPTSTASVQECPTLTITFLDLLFRDFTDHWGGYILRNGEVASLSGSSTITGFGVMASDEVDIVIANTDLDDKVHVMYGVTCELTGTDCVPPASSDSFNINTWTITGEDTFVPKNAMASLSAASDYIVVAVSTETSAEQAAGSLHRYIQFSIDLSKVTAAGTYDLFSDPVATPVFLTYNNLDTLAIYSAGDGGTMTFLTYGTENGDRLFGQFNTPMYNILGGDAGSLAATFEVTIGQSSDL